MFSINKKSQFYSSSINGKLNIKIININKNNKIHKVKKIVNKL